MPTDNAEKRRIGGLRQRLAQRLKPTSTPLVAPDTGSKTDAAASSAFPLSPSKDSKILISTQSTPNIGTQSTQKSLWEQARDSLSDKEKDFISEFVTTSVSSHSDIQTIFEAVKGKKKVCEEKSWKVTINGKEVALSDVADKVCNWLDRFKQIGDITVNVDPMHAGLPWAGIRLLLQVWNTSITSFLFYGDQNQSRVAISEPLRLLAQPLIT
jgi:hypothetical protein